MTQLHAIREPDTCARNWPTDEQPYNRIMQRGADACSDADILAVLIRSNGNRDVSSVQAARDLLAQHGSITAAIAAARDERTEQAARLVAAVELVSRALLHKARRFTWEQSINLREHVSTYTWGAPIERLKS